MKGSPKPLSRSRRSERATASALYSAAGSFKRPGSGRNRSARIAVGAAVLLGALVFAFATEGGRKARAARPIGEEFDRIAELVGLGLNQINVSGHRMTPDTEIFDALELEHVGSLLRFDSSAARRRIERLPWVQTATIEREFPDELTITLTERTPYAVWRKAEGDVLIDREGRELSTVARATAPSLPAVAGRGAATAAGALLHELSAYPGLIGRLALAERVGGRRWTLTLEEGPVIHLPADGETGAIAKIMAPSHGGRLIDRDIAVLDLRTRDQIVVRRDPAGTSSAAETRR